MAATGSPTPVPDELEVETSTNVPTTTPLSPPAKAAPKEEENLWDTLLKKATHERRQRSSSLIIFGDKGNGKSTLLSGFADRKYSKDSPEYLLEYSYVEVKNKHSVDKEDVLSRLGVWLVDEVEQVELLPVLLKQQPSDDEPRVLNTSYMITLDLSKPRAALVSLQKWLDVITKVQQAMLASLTQEEANGLREKLSRYIQFYIDPSLSAATIAESTELDGSTDMLPEAKLSAEDMNAASVDTSIPEINLGVPIFVVGTQLDILCKELGSHPRKAQGRFDYLTRSLRKECLKYGASLIYTSKNGNRGKNIDVLQDYIYHRSCELDNVLQAKPFGNIEDYCLYIPSGFDRTSLINDLPMAGDWTELTPVTDVFPEDSSTMRKKQREETKAIKAQDNSVFFKNLRADLEIHKRPSSSSSAGSQFASPDRFSTPSAKSAVRTKQDESATGTRRKTNKGAKRSRKSTKGKPKDEIAVQRFFKSLLSNNKGDPKSARKTRTDAAAAASQLGKND